MGMILRIASSRIVGQGDIVGRSGYFSLNLSANSVMRGRLDARRTLKSLVADLRNNMKKLLLSLICFIASIVCYAQTLYIYGGSDHDVFLGCLNSNKYDSKSIWNEYGTYGSKYNSKSIWNEYGTYGSSYSAYSPWNNYASYPPVIVDEEGNFYGYLTVNQYKYNRADFSLAKYLYEYYDVIRDNVGKWYDKIFY